ncbi:MULTISPECIES: GNAT family N-acetyltransferase [Bacillaceae]|uniref:GNAT family N-acetyltransferase n=1 Tax=Bacillaceae TaxID=186817 RepID=UPI001E613380|nr:MULTISPECIES: GNAT family N-acetyltransferase [Bacillaceae]MCE4047347.1 GNAT family N-acetyltransferase [Bacillus sp. Au-Bac7]MCM3030626.1 GNAT family N-acetyltransferase [Niallia sp. MER 6]MDL0437148.1 GNAT family N-acetyltransferase [Niallia sp. SS-2023]UPO86295.1 GNAT family N-acetyltransferase [Niallia sp. Man26]
MLKKRELEDCAVLFEMMKHPDVFPFVRQKAASYEEYLFITKQTIEAEEKGELISRTILDEWHNPIGTINLYDIQDGIGFLGTWIGKPYHGKGYNKIAKELFFSEAFFELNINSILMRIREHNLRSVKAAEKLPYAVHANETRKSIVEKLKEETGVSYELFEVPKDVFTLYTMRSNQEQTDDLMEA